MIKKTIITVCTLIFLISNISYADITFWTTEVQPARMAKQEAMAKDFEAKTGIKVEVIPVAVSYTHLTLPTTPYV